MAEIAVVPLAAPSSRSHLRLSVPAKTTLGTGVGARWKLGRFTVESEKAKSANKSLIPLVEKLSADSLFQ
jgi:hypothetical protein